MKPADTSTTSGFDLGAHQRHVDEMERVHAATGKYIDPATGVELPPGKPLLREPNRAQRRALKKWRKKVSK